MLLLQQLTQLMLLRLVQQLLHLHHFIEHSTILILVYSHILQLILEIARDTIVLQ